MITEVGKLECSSLESEGPFDVMADCWLESICSYLSSSLLVTDSFPFFLATLGKRQTERKREGGRREEKKKNRKQLSTESHLIEIASLLWPGWPSPIVVVVSDNMSLFESSSGFVAAAKQSICPDKARVFQVNPQFFFRYLLAQH